MSFSRTKRRIVLPALLAVALAAALLAIVPGRAAPARASAGPVTAGAAASGGEHSAKPVIVLEHGSWADASSWNSVISQLQLLGFTVYAPPNPLRGLELADDAVPARGVRPGAVLKHDHGLGLVPATGRGGAGRGSCWGGAAGRDC